ncbi:MAG: hypothetical protein WD187_00560 [Candidatus Woykebacteria bacterium]
MPDENVANQQPTTTIAIKKPINWKNILIGVVVGGVLFGGGGYLVYNAYQPKKEEPAPTSTTTKTSTPSSTTKKEEPKDETDDWNLYKNKNFGYQIKYPKNWKPYDAGIIETSVHSEKSFTYRSTPPPEMEDNNATLVVISAEKEGSTQYQSLVNFFNTFYDRSAGTYVSNTLWRAKTQVEKVDNTTIDGYAAFETNEQPSKDAGTGPYNDTAFYVKKGNVVYRIGISVSKEDSNYRDAEKIVSTFKFLD